MKMKHGNQTFDETVGEIRREHYRAILHDEIAKMEEEDEQSVDCCLLCANWTVRKPETKGEKLFWYCKKDIVETVSYDDHPGIIQMTSPFRCVHYLRATE